MIKHIQSYCKSLADNGCYLFCLFDIAEKVTGKKFDIIKESDFFIENKWIKFNKNNYSDKNNFFVLNPCKILESLTGLTWTVRKEGKGYIPEEKDIYIEFWSIDGYSGHFARTYDDFNSLEYSRNVGEGNVISYRVFNIVR